MLLKYASANSPDKIWVDDVFSSWTYPGNGATQTITNGIDLAGKGGMVWVKDRTITNSHWIADTARGVGNGLFSNGTHANQNVAVSVTGFNNNGFSLGSSAYVNNNTSSDQFIAWTFRNAPKFYTHSVVAKSAGSNATVDLSTLGTVGMVRVKRTDAIGSWYVWHRSLTAGKLLIGETTAAEATLGHITVSGTTLTLVNGVIADGTYLVEAWAHDTGADGLIQCGSFTDASAVTLGWEPQYVMFKRKDVAGDWRIVDTMRGFVATGNPQELYPNLTQAETSNGGVNITSTGFLSVITGTYAFLAVRRPNKPPTSGTQVYNAIARTGTGAAATVTGVGFAPDLYMAKDRTQVMQNYVVDRLRGALPILTSTDTVAEVTATQRITSFNMDGVSLASFNPNDNGQSYINHFFRRAPGVFSILCDTGTGSNKLETHNLGSIPELMIRKSRSGATQWEVYFASLGNTNKLVLNSNAVAVTDATAWNSTTPTATQISIGTGANVNTSSATYVTYLISSLNGISKVGHYTGNGTTQNIDMGFSAGCRFFLVKASSATGSWWIWDSVRGIVASTDFGLQLNSTSAETTSADAVDPFTGGISVVEEATCALNTNGIVYQYWGIA